MAYNDYDRNRYGQGSYSGRRGYGTSYYEDEPYYRSYGGSYGEPFSYGYGYGTYSNEPYRSRYYDQYYNEPYNRYDYGRYETRNRYAEPSYNQDYETRNYEPYSRERYGRGQDRGFFERAGDEIRSWFGDEDAERRRRRDEQEGGQYAGRGPRGYRRSDERIREDVNDRLTDDSYLDASDINVSVNDRLVTLTGTVNTRTDKRRAELVAESVTGVTDVSNQLRVNRNSEQSDQNQSTVTTGITSTSDISGTARSRAART